MCVAGLRLFVPFAVFGQIKRSGDHSPEVLNSIPLAADRETRKPLPLSPSLAALDEDLLLRILT